MIYMGNKKMIDIENKKVFDEEEIKNNILLHSSDAIGIGVLPNKEKHQRVKINITYLKKAIEMLEDFNFKKDIVTIFVKNDGITQIGKENIGVLIAPVVDD